MGPFDYLVILFYFGFMLMLGPIYKGFSASSSDFFRGGGKMLWWIVGSSSFMTTFSAWSFTGGAAKAYETGLFFILLFVCNFISLLITYFFFAAKFRQMRIITAVEGVRKRYGAKNEQVFAWLPIPFNVLFGGLGLYVIAVFMYGVFREEWIFAALSPSVSMSVIICCMGVTVTLMTLLGGSWAATAGDFLQMLVVLTITVLLSFLVIAQPEIGSIQEFVRKLPSHHFDWTEFERPWVTAVFFIALLINQTVQNNSLLLGASKYVFAKNGADAKKATLLSIVGFAVLPLIWIIPPMAACIYFPDLASRFPELGEDRANSAAYIAMAMKLLPNGLLGLLVCGIFASSITSMNSTINIAAGTFVRNIYIQIINPGASEVRQVLVGRIFIGLYGILTILVAFIFLLNKNLSIFDIVLLLAASVGIPTAVPMFLGLFIKKTPSWSAWSSMVLGFVVALCVHFLFVAFPAPELFDYLLAPEVPFGAIESGDLKIAFTTIVVGGVTITWYFLTMFFYRTEDTRYIDQVDGFFEEMSTPVPAEKVSDSFNSDQRQYSVMGKLCVSYGLFVLALVLVPNLPKDRYGIMFCGGIIFGMGLIFLRQSKKHRNL